MNRQHWKMAIEMMCLQDGYSARPM